VLGNILKAAIIVTTNCETSYIKMRHMGEAIRRLKIFIFTLTNRLILFSIIAGEEAKRKRTARKRSQEKSSRRKF